MATDANTTPPVAPKIVTDSSYQWIVDPQITMIVNSFGTVVIDLNPQQAPITVANMLAYVNSGFYTKIMFHRVIPGFMIQAGLADSDGNIKNPSYSPIPLESNNGLSNLSGTIAMARTPAPNSASSQFFINTVDNTSLNYTNADAENQGYAVFGKVVSGMSVVNNISQVPTQTYGSYENVPSTDVVISSIQQTVAGSAVTNSTTLQLSDIAVGAKWNYSLNSGSSWLAGLGNSIILPVGKYSANQIEVKQINAAGVASNISNFTSALEVDAVKANINFSKVISTVAVHDSSANINANLDNLAANASKISAITLSDNNPLSITASQLRNDASALALISGNYKLVITDTASHLNGLNLSAYHGKQIDLVVTTLTTNMTVSGGAVTELDLNHLVDATYKTSLINHGADTQINVTTKGVTQSIVLLGETPNNIKLHANYSASINTISTIGLSPDSSTLLVTFSSGTTSSIPYGNGLGSLALNDTTIATGNLEAQAKAVGAVVVPVFTENTGGATAYLLPTIYTGPASLNLNYQLIDSTQNAVITGSTSNDFIKVASTNSTGKAVNGGGGSDVIDGGVGSTFISGGAGHSGDTFFLDGRAPGVSWSTITDFVLGSDQATIWGFVKGVSSIDNTINDANTGGAENYTGLTLHFANLLPDGQSSGSNPDLNSITLSGHTLADLGVSSIAQLNSEIANAAYNPSTGQTIVNSHILIGQTQDSLGAHSYLFIH
jgi:peptidyl-prolyl cis-trans isomerase A (cyclophilin A)